MQTSKISDVPSDLPGCFGSGSSPGGYPAGTLLPGEHRLASDFRVSPITSRRALAELEKGRPHRTGPGTAVPRDRGRRSSIGSTSGSRTSSGATKRSGRPGASSWASSGVPLRRMCAARLDLVPESPVMWVERVRFLGDAPFCQVESYIPADVAEGITPGRLGRKDAGRPPRRERPSHRPRHPDNSQPPWHGPRSPGSWTPRRALRCSTSSVLARSATGTGRRSSSMPISAPSSTPSTCKMGDARTDIGEATRYELRPVPARGVRRVRTDPVRIELIKNSLGSVVDEMVADGRPRRLLVHHEGHDGSLQRLLRPPRRDDRAGPQHPASPRLVPRLDGGGADALIPRGWPKATS